MANIMLTNRCNLSCSYCFANEYVNKHGAEDISMENLKFILSWIGQSAEGPRNIGLIGGEPTIHPQFTEIVKMIVDTVEMPDVLIFTNGTTLDRVYSTLIQTYVRALINVNTRETMGEQMYDRMKFNLHTCVEMGLGPKLNLGINIYKPDQNFADFWEIWDVVKSPLIRVGIAVPNTDVMRHMDSVTYFRSMTGAFMRFLDEAIKRKALPTFDCNSLPYCALSPEQMFIYRQAVLSFARRTGNVSVKSSLRESTCHPSLDIKQDMTAIRCFGMSEADRVPLSNFENPEQLSAYFEKHLDTYGSNIPTSPECKGCQSFKTGSCMGGCLSFKKDKLLELRSITENFVEANT